MRQGISKLFGPIASARSKKNRNYGSFNALQNYFIGI